jgi:hypothetical protein
MEITIVVIWSLGLLVALLLTLVILKQVALMLRVLRGIHELAEFTRNAARGIAANLLAVPRLGAAAEPAIALRETLQALARTSGALERQLGAVAGTPSGAGE